jgi:hypothetical protein
MGEDDEIAVGGRGTRIVVGLGVALGVVAVGAWIVRGLLLPPTRPEVVLIAIEVESGGGDPPGWWNGGKASRQLRDQLDAPLRALGLEPPAAAELARVEEALSGARDEAALRSAARRWGIGYLVVGRIEGRALPKLADLEYVDLMLEPKLAILDVETGERLDAPAIGAVLVGAKTVGEGVALNDEFLAERLVAPISTGLASGGRMQVMGGPREALSVRDALTAQRLEPLFRRAKALERARTSRDEVVAAALAAVPAETGGAKRSLFGEALGETYALGVSATGGVFVNHERRVYDAAERAPGYAIRLEGEELLHVPVGGPADAALLTTFNFYSWPGVSRSGGAIAIVVDHHAGPKTLALVEVATGVTKPLATSTRGLYSSPRPSPDGSKVVAFEQDFRGDATRLAVYDVATGARHELLPSGVPGSIPEWSIDGRHVYVITEGDGSRTLERIDVSSGERTSLVGAGAVLPPLDEVEGGTLGLRSAGVIPPDPSVPGDQAMGDPASADQAVGSVEIAGTVVPPPTSRDRLAAAVPNEVIVVDADTLLVRDLGSYGRMLVRYTLSTADYEPVLVGDFGRMAVSSDGKTLAFELWTGLVPEGDDGGSDTEIAVMSTERGAVPRRISRNDLEERLGVLAADGTAVYVMEDALDPDEKHVVVRVWRYAI